MLQMGLNKKRTKQSWGSNTKNRFQNAQIASFRHEKMSLQPLNNIFNWENPQVSRQPSPTKGSTGRAARGPQAFGGPAAVHVSGSTFQGGHSPGNFMKIQDLQLLWQEHNLIKSSPFVCDSYINWFTIDSVARL